MNFLKCSKLNVLVVAGLISAMSQMAMAGHINTWTGGVDNTWDDLRNWDQGHAPLNDERAVIGASATVYIDTIDAIADSIEIASSATLTIKDGGKLQLTNCDDAGECNPDKGQNHPNSEVLGTVEIEKGGEFHISFDQTMDGDGGNITGLITGGETTAKITTASTYTLTIDGTGTDPHSQANSLVIDGTIDIVGKIDNNGFVLADWGDVVTLKGSAKDGSDNGHWVAEGNGKLVVDVEVTGSAEWQLIDDTAAEIEINADSTSLTGDFDIQEGRLDINATIDTSGDLIFRSNAGSRPRIEVAKGETATFG